MDFQRRLQEVSDLNFTLLSVMQAPLPNSDTFLDTEGYQRSPRSLAVQRLYSVAREMIEDFVPGVPVSFLQMKLWCLYVNREIESNAHQSVLCKRKVNQVRWKHLMAKVLSRSFSQLQSDLELSW